MVVKMGEIRVFLSYKFNCIFERYRDPPSVLLPQATLIVNIMYYYAVPTQ